MNYYLDGNGTLYHHGIEGQKWGKRNAAASDTFDIENMYNQILKNIRS